MNNVAQMTSSIQQFLAHTSLRSATMSVVRSLIGGITATGSVVLSEVLRCQVAKEDLHSAEQQVSHALKNESALDQLPEAYLTHIAPVARTLRFRSLDGSDVSKPASRKLEYLDVVRDGSAKPRVRVVVGPGGVRIQFVARSTPVDGVEGQRPKVNRARRGTRPGRRGPRPPRPRTETRAQARQESKASRMKFPSSPALKKIGYWMIAIDAGDGMGNHLPLFQDLFSTMDPAYQVLGGNAWTMTFQRAMERVLKHVGRGGVWLLDRGFDDVVWMVWLHERVEQYLIRLKSNRYVHPGTRQEKAIKAGQLAETLEAKHTTYIRYVDKSTHQERLRPIRFAWAPIWIDGVNHPQYLIVAHTGRKRPLLIVTDVRPNSAEEAGALIQAYLERWGNEEVTRACKQLTGLEGFRVRSMVAMRRLLWCAMIAVGIQALHILKRPQWRQGILGRAKEFIKRVRFVLYRIWRVVSEDVCHALKINPYVFT